MEEDLILFPMMFSFFAGIVWFVLTTIRRYKVAKLQAEVSNKLIDKFGSSQELLAYAQTEQGKALLISITTEPGTLFGRIVGSLQAGIVLMVFGSALLFLHWMIVGAAQTFLVFGVLILALGIGFALAGAVSYFFSKSVGLLDGPANRR